MPEQRSAALPRTRVAVWLLLVLSLWLPDKIAEAAVGITHQPDELLPSSIRDGSAEVVVQAEAPVFAVRNISVAGPVVIANASALAPLVLFADGEDGSGLLDAIREGSVVAAVRFVTPRAVVVTLHGDFYAYEDSTLYVALMRTAFEPAHYAEGPFTARVSIPADTSSLREPRRITVGSLGAVSLLLAAIGKDTHTGLLSLGRQSLIARVLECDDDLDFILHPTQVSVRWSLNFGALLMNLSIVVVLMVLHTTILRQFPKVFSPHLPGDHLLLLIVAFPGTTVATAETVIRDAAPVRWALAVVILVMLYMMVFGGLLLARSDSVVYSDRFRAWGHKTDANFITRWRVFYKPYRGGLARIYLALEIVITAFLAIAVASPRSSRTHGGCFYQSVIATSLIFIDTVVFLVVWPYHTTRDTAFAATLKAIEGAVAGESIAATLSTKVDSGMVIAGNAMLIAGAVIVFIRYAVAFVIAARGEEGSVDAISGEYIELMEREHDAVRTGPGVHALDVTELVRHGDDTDERGVDGKTKKKNQSDDDAFEEHVTGSDAQAAATAPAEGASPPLDLSIAADDQSSAAAAGVRNRGMERPALDARALPLLASEAGGRDNNANNTDAASSIDPRTARADTGKPSGGGASGSPRSGPAAAAAPVFDDDSVDLLGDAGPLLDREITAAEIDAAVELAAAGGADEHHQAKVDVRGRSLSLDEILADDAGDAQGAEGATTRGYQPPTLTQRVAEVDPTAFTAAAAPEVHSSPLRERSGHLEPASPMAKRPDGTNAPRQSAHSPPRRPVFDEFEVSADASAAYLSARNFAGAGVAPPRHGSIEQSPSLTRVRPYMSVPRPTATRTTDEIVDELGDLLGRDDSAAVIAENMPRRQQKAARRPNKDPLL